ncbi:MAG: hypothetical protein HOV94_43875 [Saccharothrix sp.]|nr:hypothetical protein [Saccharothrix sp.]
MSNIQCPSPTIEALRGLPAELGARRAADRHDHATHREANFNAEHRRPGMTAQVLATLDGTLLAVSEPVEDRTHDKTTYTLTGLDVLLADNEVVGDPGYQGTTVIRPRRKRPGHEEHTPEDKIWNTGSRIGWAVEHAIAHPKAWKILATGYRGRLAELPTIIRIVTCLEHYRLRRQTTF